MMNEFEQLNILLSEETGVLVRDRGISREDIQRTIYEAEKTGVKFVNPASGRSLAFLRPDRVTYWVEYTKVGEGYQIHTAYSHRTEMKRKGTP
ncbi:MAG TPA: hypothetical protein VHO84_10350 [Syntrophorhabdaceae bacterium]|nr:hypothetical protein [Syntrophorhabdaceae bacterium]